MVRSIGSWGKGRFAGGLLCALFAAALGTASCAEARGDWEDDHVLNPALVGTWTLTGPYPDTYTITENAVSHPDSYGYGYEAASIEYVYNFNEAKSAGCIIILKNPKYDAVYYKALTTATVVLGDAYDVAAPAQPTAVDTLEEAKTKFAPVNSSNYGGDLSAAAVMTRQ